MYMKEFEESIFQQSSPLSLHPFSSLFYFNFVLQLGMGRSSASGLRGKRFMKQIYENSNLNLSLSLSLSLSLCVCVCVCLSLSLSLSLCISLSISLCVSLSISLSLSLSLSLSVCHSVFLSVSVSLFVFQSLSLSRSLYVSDAVVFSLPFKNTERHREGMEEKKTKKKNKSKTKKNQNKNKKNEKSEKNMDKICLPSTVIFLCFMSEIIVSDTRPSTINFFEKKKRKPNTIIASLRNSRGLPSLRSDLHLDCLPPHTCLACSFVSFTTSKYPHLHTPTFPSMS